MAQATSKICKFILVVLLGVGAGAYAESFIPSMNGSPGVSPTSFGSRFSPSVFIPPTIPRGPVTGSAQTGVPGANRGGVIAGGVSQRGGVVSGGVVTGGGFHSMSGGMVAGGGFLVRPTQEVLIRSGFIMVPYRQVIVRSLCLQPCRPVVCAPRMCVPRCGIRRFSLCGWGRRRCGW